MIFLVSLNFWMKNINVEKYFMGENVRTAQKFPMALFEGSNLVMGDRAGKDKKINKRGERLIELFHDPGLIIMNGLTKGDENGKIAVFPVSIANILYFSLF